MIDLRLDLEALDDALDALERIAPEKVKVVEWRYFRRPLGGGNWRVFGPLSGHRQALLVVPACLAFSALSDDPAASVPVLRRP